MHTKIGAVRYAKTPSPTARIENENCIFFGRFSEDRTHSNQNSYKYSADTYLDEKFNEHGRRYFARADLLFFVSFDISSWFFASAYEDIELRRVPIHTYRILYRRKNSFFSFSLLSNTIAAIPDLGQRNLKSTSAKRHALCFVKNLNVGIRIIICLLLLRINLSKKKKKD